MEQKINRNMKHIILSKLPQRFVHRIIKDGLDNFLIGLRKRDNAEIRLGRFTGKGRKPLGYWSVERCKADAAKYKTRTEWQDNSNSAYTAAAKNKWLDICCANMTSKQQQWDLEKCRVDAAKYTSKMEWQK